MTLQKIIPNACILIPDFMSPEEARGVASELIRVCNWKQHTVRLFGKRIPSPRLTAFEGEWGVSYSYSGVTLKADGFSRVATSIRDRILDAVPPKINLHPSFNSVLINRYRTGSDSMGWHADDEPELGAAPLIASVTLGCSRRFVFRPRPDRRNGHAAGYSNTTEKIVCEPGNGSLLLMYGSCQRDWQHALPKTTRNAGERINLTFRFIHRFA